MTLTSSLEEKMTAKMVNLTWLKVRGELNSVLASYPAQINQKFSNLDLQNQLLIYVLNRLPNQYIVIDKKGVSEISASSLYCSTLELLEIEELIQQGIYHLIYKSDSLG